MLKNAVIFHNIDAFCMGFYIFMSIYEEDYWSAADRRDAHYLPNEQADVTLLQS